MARTRLALVAILALALGLLTLSASAPAGQGEECFGKKPTIKGSGDDELIIGTPANDVIVGRGGDDVIAGDGGFDLICANGGNDIVFGEGGNDRISLGGLDFVAEPEGLGDFQVATGDDLDSQTLDGNDRILTGGGGSPCVEVEPDIFQCQETAFGEGGDDDLVGAKGPQGLDGEGEDENEEEAQFGEDSINAKDGPDVIEATDDLSDLVNGGDGQDRCFVDPDDDVRRCEFDNEIELLGSGDDGDLADALHEARERVEDAR